MDKSGIAKKDLHFDYDLFDAVRLEDNRTAIITGYGIYDNQYWLEICYPDGVHLGAADYFSSNPEFYGPHIIGKLSEDEKKRILKEFSKAMEGVQNIYHADIDFVNSMLF
jgi:hypothetical protein